MNVRQLLKGLIQPTSELDSVYDQLIYGQIQVGKIMALSKRQTMIGHTATVSLLHGDEEFLVSVRRIK